jgi:hypothetical protein
MELMQAIWAVRMISALRPNFVRIDEDGSINQSNIGGYDSAERQLDHVTPYQFGRR